MTDPQSQADQADNDEFESSKNNVVPVNPPVDADDNAADKADTDEWQNSH